MIKDQLKSASPFEIIVRSDAPDSNITFRNELLRAQSLRRISTECGIRIEVNDVQPENAIVSIRTSFDPDWNVSEQIDLHRKKHPSSRTSISHGISTDAPEPKYRTMAVPVKSVRKQSETLKWRFSVSRVIVEILVAARAEPWTFCSEAGRQIDCNE
jgi:hypothetical protein